MKLMCKNWLYFGNNNFEKNYIQEEADIITVVLCDALFLSVFFKNEVLIIKGILKWIIIYMHYFKKSIVNTHVSIIIYLWSLYFDISKQWRKIKFKPQGINSNRERSGWIFFPR